MSEKVFLERDDYFTDTYWFRVGDKRSRLDANIWEHVRPDLKLEPGGGPVAVRSKDEIPLPSLCETAIEAAKLLVQMEAHNAPQHRHAQELYNQLTKLADECDPGANDE